MVILLAKLSSISEASCDGSLANPLIGSGQMEGLKVGDILKNGEAPSWPFIMTYGLFMGSSKTCPVLTQV